MKLTFDSKMTFQKHLRSIPIATYQHFFIFWKSSEYLMIDCSLRGALSCLFWSTVLQCGARLPITSISTGPCCQWCQFFNWGRAWVWHYTSSICGSIVYAVEDQVLYQMQSLCWHSTCSVVLVRVTHGTVASPSKVPGLGLRLMTSHNLAGFPTLSSLIIGLP